MKSIKNLLKNTLDSFQVRITYISSLFDKIINSKIGVYLLFILMRISLYFIGFSIFMITNSFILITDKFTVTIFAIVILIVSEIVIIHFKNIRQNKDEILSILISIILIVVLVSGPLAYIIMSVGSLLIERQVDIRSFGDEGDWINFIGIIIAGIITMLALFLTIKKEDKKHNFDNINRTLSMLPTIEVDHIYITQSNSKSSTLDGTIQELEMKYGRESVVIYKDISPTFIVKNNSNNIIRELKIVKSFMDLKDYDQPVELFPIGDIPNLVLKDGVVTFDIIHGAIQHNMETKYENIFEREIIHATLNIIFEYFDLKKSIKHSYTHEFKSDLLIELNTVKKSTGMKSSEENELIIKSSRIYNSLDLNIFDNMDY